jgi:hypothetical protein
MLINGAGTKVDTNVSTLYICQLCDDVRDVNAFASLISSQYVVPITEVYADVVATLQALHSHGLVLRK